MATPEKGSWTSSAANRDSAQLKAKGDPMHRHTHSSTCLIALSALLLTAALMEPIKKHKTGASGVIDRD